MGRLWRPGVLRRGVLVAVSWVLVVTTCGAVTAQAGPELPDEVEQLLADRKAPPVDPVPWAESTSAPPARSVPTDALPAPAFPEPKAWTVELRGGEPAAVVAGTEGPVKVAVPKERASGADVVGDRLAVEVLDRERAKNVGVSGFLFKVADTAGATLAGAAKAGGLPAELVIDYSGFAAAFGADFADRLAVVAFAECGLTVPLPDGCRQPRTRLETTNNAAKRQLIAKVGDLAGLATSSTKDSGNAGVTFGVLAEPSGETGSFAATDLSGTAQWQVASGSGEFSYSYPIGVPEPGVGTAPSLGLGYSSGAIDGMTNGANTQASPVGVGWSLGTAFIERRYEPCDGTAGGVQTPDLCWMNHNGTISLTGVSGTLLPINGAADNHTEWVVYQDEGWRVQRLTGASNGVHQGEHWKVTAPDGTRYFFGLGQVAETGNATSSALAVPVLAEHDTQPCWVPGRPIQACLNMGYRWMLDRVVDPDGNVTVYEYVKERQQYALMAGFGGTPWYDRAALLDKVAYGIRDGVTGTATARVLVSSEWRCGALNPDCPEPDRENAFRFPDVPNDLICRNGTECQWSPTFFTGKRYAHVQTQVRVGNAWRDAMRTIFAHGFLWDKLHLTQVGQVGLAQGGLLTNPATMFAYTELPNRVDVNEDLGRKPMYHNRLATITNPFGGRTRVSYGQNRPCARTYSPEHWDENKRDCFPQTMTHGGRHVGVFNKYLVTQVVEDPGDGGSSMTTKYTYGEGNEDPAWAFNYGSFAQYDHAWGWSNWRGYGTTRITQGASATRVRVFRGWDGDPMMGDQGGGTQWPGERRDWTVTSFAESGSRVFVDHPTYAGRVLEEQRLGTVNGQPNQVVSSTLYTYERRVTHPAPHRQIKGAEWAGVSSTTELVATAPGTFRKRGGTTTYNQHLQPATSTELGWLDVTGDERCTVTSYAENPAANMFTYPAANRMVAGANCATGTVLSASQTYYDNSSVLGQLPGPGRPTRERTQIDQSTWAETVTAFDAFGRPVRVTDPRGATTTTSYQASPAHAIPTRTTITNELGHATSTTWLPEYGVPLAETDVNGNTTSYAYDALGRTWKVWRPGHSTAGWPTWIFAYFPAADRRVIAASQLTSPSNDGPLTLQQSWTVYDGFWRERQTQVQSPAAGRVIVADTAYDERGLVRDRTAPQAVAGTPGQGLITGVAWANRTRSGYDELSRLVSQQWWRGTTMAHETTTAYGPDTVTVTGPQGNRVRETVDGLGRTIAVAEQDGDRWVSTTKGYDLAGNLTSVTDPAGNRTGYTYNLAGWQLTQTDPDRGSASFGYDAAGNQTRVTDGRGTSLHTLYDAVGRRVERRSGSPGGALLASWRYDTAPGGVGLLHRETTHTAQGQWISEITGYDNRGRARGTTVTVPGGVAGVAGSYTATRTYDGADRVVRSTLPAIGGLPAETLTTTYDNLGHVTSMVGAESYVSRVKYDDRGRPSIADLGPRVEQSLWMYKVLSYNDDQQPSGAATWIRRPDGGYGTVSDHRLGYDKAGNITDRTVSQNGLAWRECYRYDARNRLTEAHTVRADTTCTAGTPGTGDRPYVHGYRYSPDGNLLERTENGQTTRYTYPAPGGARPHAPTHVGDAAYSLDGGGNLVSRTASGATDTFSSAGDTTETFRWDAQNNLSSVEGPDGATRFAYDTSGQRLLRQTDRATTVYLFGHEVTVTAGGQVADAVRPYSFGGELVATRSVVRGVDYYVSGPAGSLEATVDSGQTNLAGTRAYEPYGQVRAKGGEGFATDRGFLGQVEDPGTGLSYLNARYYDTRTGQFLSPDPATGSNPYTYAAGNPASFADASGLSPSYISGLEIANRSLRLQNKQLRGHIRQLNGHISSLQKVIGQQNRAITKLLTHIDTLNSVIRQQQSIIRELESRVSYLIGVVQQQQALIERLRATVAYQQRIIYAQAARIRQLEGQVAYYRGIVNQLAGRLWGHNPLYLNTVLISIHSGNGIPAGAFSHDLISALQTENTRLQATVEGLFGQAFDLTNRVGRLQADITIVNDMGKMTQEGWDWIYQNRAAGFTDEQIAAMVVGGNALAATGEDPAVAEYGDERYEAGYERGRRARDYDGWDFGYDTVCYIAGNVDPTPAIDSACYVAGVGRE